MKERELEEKENNMRMLIQTYENLALNKYIQLEVSNEKNLSTYTYSFEPLTNVKSIKLISYSLPAPIFNITDANNYLVYIKESEEITFEIKKGNYNIEKLVESLKNDDFSVILNKDGYLEIEHENLEFKNTNLSRHVLGFNFDEDMKTAQNLYDLRKPDRLFLYIKNIQEEPVGIMYFSEVFQCEIVFEEFAEISTFDIEIRDVNGNEYDFVNQSHNLSFKIIFQNYI